MAGIVLNRTDFLHAQAWLPGLIWRGMVRQGRAMLKFVVDFHAAGRLPSREAFFSSQPGKAASRLNSPHSMAARAAAGSCAARAACASLLASCWAPCRG